MTTYIQKRNVSLLKQGVIGFSMLTMLVSAALPQVARAEFADYFRPLSALFNSGNSFPVSAEREPLRIMNVSATSYSSDPWQTDATPCIDASGIDICERAKRLGESDTIAANFLPKGTKVRFPDLYGKKVFTVTDRMNSRYNYERLGYYKIDFYTVVFDNDGNIDAKASNTKAREFGFKKGLTMEVLGV